ncbi:MAG: hypothetical protein ACK4NF_05900, partial [Planctomycetota bacterium]
MKSKKILNKKLSNFQKIFKSLNCKGTSLILVMIVGIVVSGAVVVGFEYAIVKDKTITNFQKLVQLKYDAESALEKAKANIRWSNYVNGRNQYLMNNASYNGTTLFTETSGDNVVTAILFYLGSYWYRLEAQATYQPFNIKYAAAVQVRERDDFSKYLFFVDQEDINIGTTTVRGQVHSNKRLKNYFGGAKYYENVEAANQGTGPCPGGCTCTNGFAYCSGATPGNTFYYKGADSQAQVIPMPTTNDIATLHNEAVDCYKVSNASPCWSGFGNFNTEIEFIGGEQVKITAKHLTNGSTLKSVTLPLPPNNLIFVQNKVTKLEGDLRGRVTIAVADATRCSSGSPDSCNAAVNITNSINYIDQDGDKAYLLYDANGNVVNNTPAGVRWTEPTYTYKPNPNYNPSLPSNLTIMAVGDIKVKCSAPYNMTMHGVFFSAQGNWHLSLGCGTNAKGNFRYVGAMISKYADREQTNEDITCPPLDMFKISTAKEVRKRLGL